MRQAVKLLMAKLLSNIFAKGLSSFLLGLGKFFVTASGAVICGVLIYFMKDKQIIIMPCIVCGVCCFIVAYYLLEVVVLVIDTIYLSFLYEETFMMR